MTNYKRIEGLKAAVKLADYLKTADFSDFAPFYYRSIEQSSALRVQLNSFITLMAEAGIHPFMDLDDQLDPLQKIGLIQLIVSPYTYWLLENSVHNSGRAELFKSIGFEAWLYKPANRVMFILPEKADIHDVLGMIRSIEEVGQSTGLISSNIEDWQKL